MCIYMPLRLSYIKFHIIYDLIFVKNTLSDSSEIYLGSNLTQKSGKYDMSALTDSFGMASKLLSGAFTVKFCSNAAIIKNAVFLAKVSPAHSRFPKWIHKI